MSYPIPFNAAADSSWQQGYMSVGMEQYKLRKSSLPFNSSLITLFLLETYKPVRYNIVLEKVGDDNEIFPSIFIFVLISFSNISNAG